MTAFRLSKGVPFDNGPDDYIYMILGILAAAKKLAKCEKSLKLLKYSYFESKIHYIFSRLSKGTPFDNSQIIYNNREVIGLCGLRFWYLGKNRKQLAAQQ